MKQALTSKKTMLAVALCFSSFVWTSAQTEQTDVLRLGLNDAIAIALSESPTVKIANKEIEKKKYAHKGAYAALFPQINFSADYTRTLKKQVMYMDGAFDMGAMLSPIVDPIIKGTEQTLANSVAGYNPGDLSQNIMQNTPPPVESSGNEGISVGRDNNWGVGFSAGMPLINPVLWKSLDISALDVELAVEQARSSKIDLLNQVRKSYYAVLLANDSYTVFRDSYNNALKNYNDVKSKFDQGLVAEYDLIRTNVAVRNVEPNMLQAANALVLAQWQLKAVLGLDLEQEIECSGALSDFSDELFADFISTDASVLDNNTTLKQFSIQEKQLKESLTLQKFEYLPTLSLSGAYQWTAMNNDFRFKDYMWNPFSMVGLSLSVPIFSGGGKVNKIKQTQTTIAQLYLQKDDLERNLRLAIKQSVDNMSTCVKRFDASRKGIEQAERGYAIAQKRYETGAGTLLELNDAELALTQSRLNLNQSIYEYVVSKAELERILGTINY